MKNRFILTLIFSLVCCLDLFPADGSWTVESVDPSGGGMFTSLQIDSRGGVHVAYLNGADQSLKYAFRDPVLGRWFTTIVDRESSGFCSLTLDSKEHPHISHLAYGTGKLKYSFWDGVKWNHQVLEIPAKQIDYYTSIALDSKDRPTISFYEYFDANHTNSLRLRTISFDGKQWELHTVDDTRGSGKFNSIAIDSHDQPHIAYADVDYANATLRFADWDGKAWRPSIIEGVGGGDYGVFSVSLALSRQDVPHIAYTHTFQKRVKYITRVDGRWISEDIGPVQKVSYPDRNGMALDDLGVPYVSYYDEGPGILKIAHKTPAGWISESVDTGFSGFTSSLRIRDGQAWVSYKDANGLRVAHRRIDVSTGALQSPARGTRD